MAPHCNRGVIRETIQYATKIKSILINYYCFNTSVVVGYLLLTRSMESLFFSSTIKNKIHCRLAAFICPPTFYSKTSWLLCRLSSLSVPWGIISGSLMIKFLVITHWAISNLPWSFNFLILNYL